MCGAEPDWCYPRYFGRQCLCALGLLRLTNRRIEVLNICVFVLHHILGLAGLELTLERNDATFRLIRLLYGITIFALFAMVPDIATDSAKCLLFVETGDGHPSSKG